MRQTYSSVKRRWDNGARILAENLGENRFKVETENVKRFRIYLSPQMGDLEKPFTVDLGSYGVRTIAVEPISGNDDYVARLTVVVKEDL